MRPRFMPICEFCKHFIPGLDPNNDRGRPVCAAFPGQAIPSEILYGAYDHRKPLNDEHILFELADEYDQTDVDRWEQQVLEIEKAELLAKIKRYMPYEPDGEWFKGDKT